MSLIALEHLAWLPESPSDFKGRVAAIDIRSSDAGEQLRALASHRLSDVQLNRLAKLSDRFVAEGNKSAAVLPVKIAVIGNVTTNLFVKGLKATALRYGIALDLYEAEYDQMAHECLSPNSGLNTSRSELVFIALDHRNMNLGSVYGDEAAARQAVEAEFAKLVHYLQAMTAAHTDHAPPMCIIQGLVPPMEAVFGNQERGVAGTLAEQIAQFNTLLVAHCAKSSDLMFDLQPVANMVGLQNWHNPVLWHMGKLNFAPAYIPFYCDHLARLIAAVKGKTKKVLVLDLDNTVWGGVVGDDGVDGICIGQGSAVGEAFLDIQNTALALRQRGIVLAVCSKNEDATAREPFRKLRDMLLKEEHFAAFQANWNDKATNIKAIADHLSLGLDSFVFLDDNPAERARVRQMLPQVAVPELPEDPAYFTRMLMAAGYFETTAFSTEDQKRAEFYAGNANRLELQNSLGSYEDYLISLDMEIEFSPFDDIGRSRIVQLINKTNQFNLTTKRYTENQVKSFQSLTEFFTLQVRLKDKFGDNGMINVIICEQKQPEIWHIDAWLMSCRVLKRGVENAVLNEIVRHARAQGVTTITGTYIPTAKNDLVRDHYKNLGFAFIDQVADSFHWSLSVANYQDVFVPMAIAHSGF